MSVLVVHVRSMFELMAEDSWKQRLRVLRPGLSMCCSAAASSQETKLSTWQLAESRNSVLSCEPENQTGPVSEKPDAAVESERRYWSTFAGVPDHIHRIFL